MDKREMDIKTLLEGYKFQSGVLEQYEVALALESIYRNDKDSKIRAVAKEALEAAGYTF